MVKGPRGHSVPLLREPRDAPGLSLYRRLYQRIRDGVLEGAIPPGTRLPAARTLAREEGISRNTVEAALRRLQAEGFVVRHVGAGTWISDRIPTRLVRSGASGGEVPVPRPHTPTAAHPLLSARGRRVAEANPEPDEPAGLLFTPSGPGLEDLPLTSWSRVTRRRTRQRTGELLAAPPPAGLPALREAVATYLHMDRGVRRTGDRVVIVNSTQQAIDLAARLLLDPGDAVWLEDPGYMAARRAFVAAGAQTVAVPVDSEGIDVAAGTALATDARLAYVTPSHQYPLGMTLSLARRLELIAWATRSDAWILEDDYDSELRYDGQPLASIQGIDESERVIYVGTFNKILFPGVRAAYLVLPQVLVEPFTRAKALADGFTSPFVQGVLADFIGEGHFAVHLRRVRELYRERRDAFRRAAVDHLSPDAVLGPAEAGIHIALHLPDGIDDRRLSERALREGLAVPALSAQSIERTVRGLLVHYGHVPVPKLDSATRRLAGVLQREREGRAGIN